MNNFLDTLKDEHTGTLVLAIFIPAALFLWGSINGIQALAAYEPWSVASTILAIAAIICFIHTIPIIRRRIQTKRLSNDVDNYRMMTPFSYDQADSNASLRLVFRLQACSKRATRNIVIMTSVTLALACGSLITHNKSEAVLTAIYTQQRTEALYTQQRTEALAIQIKAQELEAELLNEIELRRAALLTNISNTLIALLATEPDPADRLSKELQTCKKKPNRCFRVDSQGLSYLLDDHIGLMNRYKNALNEIIAHKLDDLLKQSINSIASDHESTIANLQQTWIQKADQHFFDFYNSGIFQDTYKNSKYINAITSAKIKDQKMREIIAQMWYFELLEKAIHSQPEFSTSPTTHTHLIVFTSNFQTEAQSKYKETDFDGPKAVRVKLF